MYLEDLLNVPVTKESGRFGRVIQHCRRKGREPPGIYYLFAQRPEAAIALSDYMQSVMRGPSELSAGERELIAGWTSARNHCKF